MEVDVYTVYLMNQIIILFGFVILCSLTIRHTIKYLSLILIKYDRCTDACAYTYPTIHISKKVITHQL